MVTADQIKRGRYATGRMTQRRLAELLGVSLRTVQHYEGGRPIPLGVQDDLAEVLNLPAGTYSAPQHLAAAAPESDRPLRAATDRDLMYEIARRLADYQTDALFGLSDTRRGVVISQRDRDNDRAVGGGQDYITSVDNAALVGTRPTEDDNQGGATPRPSVDQDQGQGQGYRATGAGR